MDERGLERYNTLLWRVLVNEQRGSVARMLVRNYADIFASPSYRIALPHLDGGASSKLSKGLLFRNVKIRGKFFYVFIPFLKSFFFFIYLGRAPSPVEKFEDMYCRLGNALRRMLFQERFSDFQFLVGEEIIFAHRAILYCRSSFFRNLFYPKTAKEKEKEKEQEKEKEKEKEQETEVNEEVRVYRVNAEAKETLKLVLKWIYSDTFSPMGLDQLQLRAVESLANSWGLTRLSAICEAAINAPSWKSDREAITVFQFTSLNCSKNYFSSHRFLLPLFGKTWQC